MLFLNEDAKTRVKLSSTTRVLITHLIKFKYQPEKQSSSWMKSIKDSFNNNRKSLEDAKTNDILYVKNKYSGIYETGVRKACNEMKNGVTVSDIMSSFPEFSFDDLINKDFIYTYVDTYMYNDSHVGKFRDTSFLD